MKEIKLYEASDYAGLECGDFKFYFGYEEIYPKDSEDGEWAFVVFKKDQEILRVGRSELEDLVDNSDSNIQFILAGIAKYGFIK